MPAVSKSRSARSAREPVLLGAVDVARAAAEEVALPGQVGEHLGAVVEGDRLVTHRFVSLVPGYRDWYWAVTLARPPRGRSATVDEVEMLPGDGALLAPEWLPWSERLEPGDVGPEDVLPYVEDDERLEQGYEATGEDADEMAIYELGLGRPRVLSAYGRSLAMTRWYQGDHGPYAPTAKAAKAQCSTCGFFMKLAGSPRTVFGVCGNEWSPDDGRVVAVDHGCGAHSETDGPRPAQLWTPTPPVRDEMDLEILATAPVPPEVISHDGEEPAAADGEGPGAGTEAPAADGEVPGGSTADTAADGEEPGASTEAPTVEPKAADGEGPGASTEAPAAEAEAADVDAPEPTAAGPSTEDAPDQP
ncbi:DUF3027 domain-containing protein [Georgenia sp. TF02-10]|uniref:DUF3027 domain-containing protein n=1 Tax=Georgenia sp. TF02-10 TaxID=2917725 RepID=UPI001FA7C453|nr:DUF3027 domain-containing protein [Georgenia sp. TF02-10]UNX55343.1 DUF3027 domain-containing protein [Georgenia sp. TF02-10]